MRLASVCLLALVACGSSQSTPDAPPSDTPPPAGGGPHPGCGGPWSETLPNSASLSDLQYVPAKAQSYVVTALERRYPIGKFILEGGIGSALSGQQGSCFDKFIRDKSTSDAVLLQAETLVHECGHFFDLSQWTATGSTYVVTPDLKLSCDGGDTTTRGGKTFARSRMRDDAYSKKRPPCGGTPRLGCDTYADQYLDGTDADDKFQSGDQGFSNTLEEAVQYVSSLATSLAFVESFQGIRSSQRDGILTFLWYVERYLSLARTQYQSTYDFLSKDPCWRQAILTVWDRGWFYLDATKGKTNLGLDDAAIEPLVKDKSLTAEIDTLRQLECNP